MPPVVDRALVLAALAKLSDPETGRSVVTMEQVKEVAASPDRVRVVLGLASHSAPLKEVFQATATKLLQEAVGSACAVEVSLVPHVRPPQKLGEIGLSAKSVIAVGSGKGGVGKSTIAASLAHGLSRFGCVVGLMDADVYGPSIPHLVGSQARAELQDKKIVPIEAAGLKVMSMGFMVPPDQAVVWRGPMLHGAIVQMLRDTAWGDLDYLIIDMPPGTGDIAITLAQTLPLTGAVVVCTPQDVALLDAVKAINMFRKVNIPVLGMVENMSYFVCPDCGKRYDIFGHGGAQRRAAELDVPFLGEVPINIQIRVNGDDGALAQNFQREAGAEYFEAICLRLAQNLAEKHSAAPPLPTLQVL